MFNFNLTEASELKKLQLSELEDIQVEAYARPYKERAELFYDRHIL